MCLTTINAHFFLCSHAAPSILRHKGTPEHPPPPSPRVLFTGVVDKEGERTLRQLGGELVHSVFECTHLVTDKVETEIVRCTVKPSTVDYCGHLVVSCIQ